MEGLLWKEAGGGRTGQGLRHPPVCPGMGWFDLQGLLSDIPSCNICHVFWAVHVAVHPMMWWEECSSTAGNLRGPPWISSRVPWQEHCWT